jgi:hypothetical protein
MSLMWIQVSMRRPEERTEDMANAIALQQEDIEKMSVRVRILCLHDGIAHAVVSRTSIILGWG